MLSFGSATKVWGKLSKKNALMIQSVSDLFLTKNNLKGKPVSSHTFSSVSIHLTLWNLTIQLLYYDLIEIPFFFVISVY